ncbi:acyclic terpene utilization AtuA family protein, partial [Acinetobacter baumannii]
LPRVAELAAQNQLQNLDTGRSIGELAGRLVAANGYLGGWGIAAALERGADIVVTGRVSDAALVIGPAAWWHGWKVD